MIHFTLEGNPAGTFVDAYEANGIRIAGRTYRQSLLLTPAELQPWAPEGLDEDAVTALLRLAGDVYLIGTGQRQTRPDIHLLAPFYQRGLGVEIMHSAAACRTFNILAAEGRTPVAGILFEPPLD